MENNRFILQASFLYMAKLQTASSTNQCTKHTRLRLKPANAGNAEQICKEKVLPGQSKIQTRLKKTQNFFMVRIKGMEISKS